MRFTMLLSTVGLSGAMINADAMWQQIASVLGSAAVWAQRHATSEDDAQQFLADLTYRLRNPGKDALAHPVVTLRRKMDRRRAS